MLKFEQNLHVNAQVYELQPWRGAGAVSEPHQELSIIHLTSINAALFHDS